MNETQNENKSKLTIDNIKSILQKSKDVVFSEILIDGFHKKAIDIVYIEGLIEKIILNDDIIKPIIQDKELKNARNDKDIIDLLQHGIVYLPARKTSNDLNDVIKDILNGGVAFVFSNENKALIFNVNIEGFEKRSITEPTIENVTKGSKDSFVETLNINIATIRRKIKAPNLVVERRELGKQSITSIVLVYMEGLADNNLINEVKNRIDNIIVDNVVTTGFVEEYIIQKPYSLFPQVIATERPDKFSANIIEGRVGIIVDGIPFASIVPATLNQFLQVPDDYSQNYIFVSLIRLMRYILILITLFLPGFYIAVTTFHQGMIPAELAASIEASKQGVPFPTFVEVIIMLAAFEVLQEAGNRLPKTIGQSISIVGAVVVGQAVVSARIISAIVVVVIAITGMAAFAIPYQDLANALKVYRVVAVILSSIIGLFGLSLSFIFLIYLLCRIESFGVPYLSPFILMDTNELKDSFIRFPLFKLKMRPYSLKVSNRKRQK